MFSGAEVNTVFNSLPVALITTDSSGLIVGSNPAAQTLFGYEKLELDGQPIELLIPSRFAANHQKHYQGFVGHAISRPMGQGRDLWALRKDGTEFPVEVGLTVLPSKPPLYLASILDLTFRKQTEEFLRERQTILERDLEEARKTLEDEVAEKTRLEERQRLGRELHDSLSQNLYGIGLGLRASLAKMGKGGSPEDALQYCLNLTEASLVEMRALLFKLRPKSLENVPLEDVLSSHTQAVTARTKIPIEFVQQGKPKADVSFEQKYALFRISTEALHNCMKHARAKNVKVALHYGRHEIEVQVCDNGRGFDAETVRGGHGMATMKERAEAVGGTLSVVSDEEGTCVKASVPWVR